MLTGRKPDPRRVGLPEDDLIMGDNSILSVTGCSTKGSESSPPGGDPVPEGVPPAQGLPRSPSRTRVLVADTERIFRLGLEQILASDARIEVLAGTGQPDQMVSEVERLQPDVMFVQREMLVSGAGMRPVILELSRATKLVITAAGFAHGEAVDFVESGASGALLKTEDPALFVKCVHAVAEGQIWLPKHQVAEVTRRLREHGRRPADTLTARERLIISCVVQKGWRNREIAQHLSIAEQTVKNHLRSIYDKVGVSDRVELVLYAIHQRLDLPTAVNKE